MFCTPIWLLNSFASQSACLLWGVFFVLFFGFFVCLLVCLFWGGGFYLNVHLRSSPPLYFHSLQVSPLVWTLNIFFPSYLLSSFRFGFATLHSVANTSFFDYYAFVVIKVNSVQFNFLYIVTSRCFMLQCKDPII